MDLYADRFILRGRRRALDLATGLPVLIWRRSVAAAAAGPVGEFDDAGWPRVGDPCLIDWGAVGAGEWFVARRAMRSAREPDGAAPGHRVPGDHATERRNMEETVRALADILDTAVLGEIRQLRLAGHDDSLVNCTVLAVARLGRQRGFVPLSIDVLDSLALREWGLTGETIWSVVSSRHLLLLHGHRVDGRSVPPRRRLARWLNKLSEAAGRPRAVIVVETAPAHERLSQAGGRADAVRLDPAASSLDSADPPESFHGHSRPCRVAEAGSSYGTTSGPKCSDRARPAGVATVSAPLVAPCRTSVERTTRALDLAARGRHARAERLLRDAIGQFTRRGLAVEAGDAGLALGRVLLRRGRTADAIKAFSSARLRFAERGEVGEAARSSVYIGLALTDDRRFDEAEGTLTAARAAALAAGDGLVERFAAVGLGRCLLWAGHAERARAATARTPPSDGAVGQGPDDRPIRDRTGSVAHDAGDAAESGWSAGERPGWSTRVGGDLDLVVAEACLDAGIATALGEMSIAGGCGARALARAESSGSLDDRAAARTALAALQATSADTDALRHHVRLGLEAARQAHAPVRAIRLRLILAEGLARAGASAEARRLANRLRRLAPCRLPPLYRTQWSSVLTWATGAGATDRGAAARPPGSSPARWVTDRAIELIAAVQSDADDDTVLGRVAHTLLGQVGGCAVGVWAQSGGEPVLVAGAGGRMTATSRLRRAIDAGLVMPPARTDAGIEAAAPVRFAGAVAGAVAIRWTIDSRVDSEATSALLATAATAVAPLVRARLDRVSAAPVEGGDGLVGTSDAMAGLRRLITRAGACPFPVLIEGESGSGKEVVARAIHRSSVRRARHLVPVNCAAVNDELFEAELFGHARGAFTGAIAERPGLIEEAHGGTLFLDEVSELSPRAQAKLLRVIQEGEIRRVGENLVRPVDVRLLVATNRSLRAEAAAGRFRQDLLYRLEVLRVEVPPLREHVEDIPALARHFWEQATSRVGSRATLSATTTAALARYDWPGNVRELQNVLAVLSVSVGPRGVVGPAHLPSSIATDVAASGRGTLEAARRLFERRYVRAALARAGGHRGRAATDLGLSRQGLAKLMFRLQLDATEMP